MTLIEAVYSNQPQDDAIDYFLGYQVKWIQDPNQISIRDKSRRTGGTETVAFEALLWGLETKMKSKDIWFTSADKKAAEEFILATKNWCKVFDAAAESVGEEIINPDSEDDFFLKYEIKIPLADGSMLRVHAMSSNVNSFHGKQGFMIIDEMARHKDQVGLWEGAFPATLWGYPLRIISTQNGKGFFYQLCQECKKGKHPDWGYHHVDIYEAVEDGLYDKIAQGQGLIDEGETTTKEQREEWIESIRRNCLNEKVWKQQFLCEAEDEGEAFLPYELIWANVTDDIILRQNIIPELWIGDSKNIGGPNDDKSRWVHESLRLFREWWSNQKFEGDVYIGNDVARSKHKSVFWAAEKKLDILVTRLILTLQNIPYWVQRELGFALMHNKRVMRYGIDKTGKGENLAEDLEFEFGSLIIPVGFTNQIKIVMAERLKAKFEDRGFRIPDDPVLHADLHQPKKETSPSGNTIFKVEEELDENGEPIGHADRFWAGAILNYVASEFQGPVVTRTSRKRESSKILYGYD